MSAVPSSIRPLTVDLRDLPQEAMSALHREAERQSIPLSALLGRLVAAESDGLLRSDGRTSGGKQEEMKPVSLDSK